MILYLLIPIYALIAIVAGVATHRNDVRRYSGNKSWDNLFFSIIIVGSFWPFMFPLVMMEGWETNPHRANPLKPTLNKWLDKISGVN